MKKKPIGRVMPPQFKNVLDIGFHRQFTMCERIKILLGFNVNITMAVACEHSPGKFQPVMDLSLTPAIKPKTTPK